MQSPSSQPSGRYRSPYTTFGVIALVATVALGLLLTYWFHWNLYWTWLLVVNVVTFLFFRFDKRQAQHDPNHRVPEMILLALLLAGGVLGGAGGMLMPPRHKTHKPLFWIVLVVAAALHGYMIYTWFLA
jgi:uncharacterized membrane protein YsdA (DUF1294 family)